MTTAISLPMLRRADVRDFGATVGGDPTANRRALYAAMDWLVEGTAPAEFFVPSSIRDSVDPIHVTANHVGFSRPFDSYGSTIFRDRPTS